MNQYFYNYRPFRRAFSLIEVLLAVFILGIGLIMVASVFPVAGNWTRQATEDSLGQTISLNAVSIIKAHYGQTGNASGQVASIGSALSGLPSLTTYIPTAERSYQYGNSQPFPAKNPAGCTYFWTALVRLSPGIPASTPVKVYDLYIVVFHKGDAQQNFTGTSVINTRDDSAETYMPFIESGSYAAGTPLSDGTITNAIPPLGFSAIGVNSGTVFRQGLSAIGAGAVPRPALSSNDSAVLYAPPADGTNNTSSPLVYVYQTTISF